MTVRAALRRAARILAVGLPLALLGGALFLWWKGGRDARYVARVLWHGDSDTDDLSWKRHAAITASSTPRPWPEAPACPAVDAAFARAGVPSLDPWLRRGGARALVVVRAGAIACEWYRRPADRDRGAMAFSVSKTLTSLLAARAVVFGAVASLDEPIAARIPELARRDERLGAITLAELLDLRSGLGFSEDAHFPWVDQDAPAVYYASDLARTVVRRPRLVEPRGTFRYNDYAPNLVGLALERATGTRAAAATQALWHELGAETAAAWLVDEHGFAWHESGFVVTARDLARVGQLVLDGGKVGDQQVAPVAWIERSRDDAGRAVVATFAGTGLGYRNGWWRLDGDLVAMGRFGQLVVVDPRAGVVIVRLGDGGGDTNVALARTLATAATALSP